MDKLPQELINKIVLCLERYPDQAQVPIIAQGHGQGDRSKLPLYATLSRRWREAVEFVTFHSLYIDSNELRQFQAMVTGNRRRYLTRLRFAIVLPEYSEETFGRVESAEEQALNNESFTQAIVDLFSILRKWEDAGVACGLWLQLDGAHCLSDGRDRGKIRLEMAQRKRETDIFEKRWADSYLHLSRPERIPSLSNIVYLRISGHVSRKLAPAVGPSLAALLHNLRGFYWEFGEVDSDAINVENRSAFAEMLEQTAFNHWSAAEINFHQDPPEDHRVVAPSRIPPSALYDPFSAALRVFSQNLTSLVVNGFVDSSLFWPSIHETSRMPSWPALQKLTVLFNMASPSGAWYFDGTPDESEEQFREHPRARTLNPFLTAFAKAVHKMPVLEHFRLETELGYDTGFWDISYHAPGLKAEGDESEDDIRAILKSLTGPAVANTAMCVSLFFFGVLNTFCDLVGITLCSQFLSVQDKGATMSAVQQRHRSPDLLAAWCLRDIQTLSSTSSAVRWNAARSDRSARHVVVTMRGLLDSVGHVRASTPCGPTPVGSGRRMTSGAQRSSARLRISTSPNTTPDIATPQPPDRPLHVCATTSVTLTESMATYAAIAAHDPDHDHDAMAASTESLRGRRRGRGKHDAGHQGQASWISSVINLANTSTHTTAGTCCDKRSR
ncbi:hypothetical protein OPT61_g10313 [Boeremia exigua]|uniref:Uncharacterized protein n=1 Tax=Boeremia exigua TaxID=749465 RepID=A0ACC2HQ86_9PLEO|nr:hypothetical protein OPT61_g10313 [Boeremia exigua]